MSHNALESIEIVAMLNGVDTVWLIDYVSDMLTVAKSIKFHDNGKVRVFTKDSSGIIQVSITRGE